MGKTLTFLGLTNFLCQAALCSDEGSTFDLGRIKSDLNGLVVFPTFFNLSLYLAIRSS